MVTQTKSKLFFVFLAPVLTGLLFAFLVSNRCAALPVDDAYILGKYALNLAQGNGFSFNAGEVSFGSTSFLFPGLVSIPLRIPSLNFELIAHIYGKISFLLLVFLVELWVWRLTRDGGATLLSGFLTSLSPMGFMNAISGMETTTFTLALLGSFAIYTFYGLKKPIFFGLVSGISVLLRPEGFIALAIPVFDSLLVRLEKCKVHIKEYLIFLVTFCVLVLPYLSAVKTTTGNWLPTTYQGKIISTDPFMHQKGLVFDILWGLIFLFKGHWRTFAQWGIIGIFIWVIMVCGIAFLAASLFQTKVADDGIREKRKKILYAIFLLCFSVGAVVASAIFSPQSLLKIPLALTIIFLGLSWLFLFRNLLKSSFSAFPFLLPVSTKTVSLVVILFLPFVYGTLFRAGPIFGGYYNRYIMPLVPASVILFSLGLTIIFRYFAVKKVVRVICLILFVGYPLWGTSIRLPYHKAICNRECSLNSGIRYQAGEWLKNNTPRESLVFTGYTGLGIVGFYANRRILDMGALINPDIFDYYRDVPARGAKRWQRTIKYMLDKKVDYFVTAPGIEDEPTSDPDGSAGFELVASFTAPNKDSPLKAITIWKIDREKIKATKENYNP